MKTKHSEEIARHFTLVSDLLLDEINDLKLGVDAIEIKITIGCTKSGQGKVNEYCEHVGKNYYQFKENKQI